MYCLFLLRHSFASPAIDCLFACCKWVELIIACCHIPSYTTSWSSNLKLKHAKEHATEMLCLWHYLWRVIFRNMLALYSALFLSICLAYASVLQLATRVFGTRIHWIEIHEETWCPSFLKAQARVILQSVWELVLLFLFHFVCMCVCVCVCVFATLKNKNNQRKYHF